MIDLALNSNFSVHLDDTNDIAAVEGNATFEQLVVVRLTDFMYNTLPGLVGNSKTTKERIRQEATRVARETNSLDAISRIAIEQVSPSTYSVTIEYLASDDFQFEIEE